MQASSAARRRRTGWRCLPAAPATSPQTGSTPPTPPTTPFFSAPSYIWNKIGGEDVGSTDRLYITDALQRNLNVETGLTGSLGAFDWDAFYSHGQSRLRGRESQQYRQRQIPRVAGRGDRAAGHDGEWRERERHRRVLGHDPAAVRGPLSRLRAHQYRRPEWAVGQRLQLSQATDFVDPAPEAGQRGASDRRRPVGTRACPPARSGPIVSADARWATYEMESDALPTEFVNCTGLRMCLANGGAPVRWVQNTNAPVDASNHVFEVALEVNVPLLKTCRSCQEVSTNWAGRYTKYSSFGAVGSWKGGIDWHVNDAIRFRGTMSTDIRAPNLNDLYQPAGVSSTGFTDLLTGGNNSLRLVSRGNAGPDAGEGAHHHGGHGADTVVHSESQSVCGLLPDEDDRRDHSPSAIRIRTSRISCLASAPSLRLAVLHARGPPHHQPDRSELQESERQLPDRDTQLTAECRASGDAWATISRSTTAGTWAICFSWSGRITFRHS